MNTSELINAVAKETGVSKATAKLVIYGTLRNIVRQVGKRETVKLSGFGTFKTVSCKAHEGRNPSTGAPMKIPMLIRPAFTSADGFKTYVCRR